MQLDFHVLFIFFFTCSGGGGHSILQIENRVLCFLHCHLTQHCILSAKTFECVPHNASFTESLWATRPRHERYPFIWQCHLLSLPSPLWWWFLNECKTHLLVYLPLERPTEKAFELVVKTQIGCLNQKTRDCKVWSKVKSRLHLCSGWWHLSQFLHSCQWYSSFNKDNKLCEQLHYNDNAYFLSRYSLNINLYLLFNFSSPQNDNLVSLNYALKLPDFGILSNPNWDLPLCQERSDFGFSLVVVCSHHYSVL